MSRRALCTVAIMASSVLIPSTLAGSSGRTPTATHSDLSWVAGNRTARVVNYAVTITHAQQLAAWEAAAAYERRHRPVVHHQTVTAVVSAPRDLASVMQCIKDHESGDYTRNSHGSSGASGAYQIVGSTWRAWSERAGRAGYSAAYLAPPSVQDAVVLYMLTHGGAHNWDPRYGNDPCTVGLP